jgi:phosphatidylglycerol:prolipoprotein diacylglycerol transferase
MQPTVLGVRAYPLFVVVAIGVGVAASLLCARRAGLPLGRYLAAQALLLGAAVLGAKLWALIEQGQLYAFPHGAFDLDGFRYPGGLLATLAVLPLLGVLFRISAAELGDVIAAPIALAMATVRVGCLLQGCCFGSPTAMPLGVRFPVHSPAWNEHVVAGLVDVHDAYSLPVHPLQAYFGSWSLAVAVFLLAWWTRRQHAGQLFLLLLVLHEAGKGALEFLRVPPRPDLRLASFAVALAAAAALALCAVVAGRRPLREHIQSGAVP